MDVDQLDREVGVAGVGGDEERDADRAGDVERLGQRVAGVDQDVVARLDAALVEGALRLVAQAAEVAAARRDGVHRVVGEGVVGGSVIRTPSETAVSEEAVRLAATR